MLHASQLCVKHVDAFSLCSGSAGEDTTEPHTYDTPYISQPVVGGAQVEGGGGQSGGGEEDEDRMGSGVGAEHLENAMRVDDGATANQA